MSNTKLILVEGLPGSGKSTTARLITEILEQKGHKVSLFVEGDTEHPADFESWAYLSRQTFETVIADYPDWRDHLEHYVVEREDFFFLIPYFDAKYEAGEDFPESLFNQLSKYDIYEWPALKNQELITERWTAFTEKAQQEDRLFVFECAFIQNPLTATMVKENAPRETAMSYVRALAQISEPLDPVLVYVDQNDLEKVFHKALEERPESWANFFISYYTEQGYGKAHGLKGIEGTLKVLEARKAIESELFKELKMKKRWLNNSSFDLETYKVTLAEQLIQLGF